MKRLLVVDEDPAVLPQLRALLADRSSEWEVAGAATPLAALAACDEAPFDVAVVNTHLSGTGGLQLLAEIKKRHPQSIRIATSEAAHKSLILRALEVAHQFLPKPIALEGLNAALTRTGSLREKAMDDSVKRVIADLQTLPSVPTIYQELVADLQSPHTSVESAARIVSRDMAMVSKILQVVNSAYFGLRRTISSPAHAIALLGIDTVKSLALSLQVFSQFHQTAALPVSIDALWKHGLATGTAARAIAQREGVGTLAVEGAFIAGLVHDLGVLVLGTNFPAQYAEALRLNREEQAATWQAERAIFGATHGEVGGYLLGIWGLSDAVVDAVTHHHRPSAKPGSGFSVLAAVHVANVFDEERDAALAPGERTSLDGEYLNACGLADRIAAWRDGGSKAA